MSSFIAKIGAFTLWVFLCLIGVTLLHSPGFLEILFPQKKWRLTHVLQNEPSSKAQIEILLNRKPALDMIEQVAFLEVPLSVQRRLQDQGYKLLSAKSSLDLLKMKIPNKAFFLVTSYKGEPVYSGLYQNPNQELKVTRSLYGKARQEFYAGFSCGETMQLQSALAP